MGQKKDMVQKASALSPFKQNHPRHVPSCHCHLFDEMLAYIGEDARPNVTINRSNAVIQTSNLLFLLVVGAHKKFPSHRSKDLFFSQYVWCCSQFHHWMP